MILFDVFPTLIFKARQAKTIEAHTHTKSNKRNEENFLDNTLLMHA